MLSNFLISPRCLLDFQIFSNLTNYKDPPIYLKLESRVYTGSYNPVRNILKKIEKWSKVRQDCTTLISVFMYLLSNSAQIYFCRWNWILEYVPMQFWNFPNISLFPKVLTQVVRQLVRQLLYKVFFIRYQIPFYLWQISDGWNHLSRFHFVAPAFKLPLAGLAQGPIARAV